MVTINTKEFTTILFDKDGTLFDSERVGIERRLAYARKQNFPLTEAILLQCIGKSHDVCVEIIQEHLGSEYRFLDFERAFLIEEEKLDATEKIPLRRDADWFITYLFERNIQIGMVTSSSHNNAQKNIKNQNLEHCFSLIIGADDVMFHKPHPEPYLKAVDLLGASKEATLVFEDSPSGVEAALCAGLNVVYVRDLVELPDDLLKKTFFQIDKWDDIRNFLI